MSDSYIFGGNTGLSYEELQQRRAIALALAKREKGFPKNKGEGLTYLGESIAEGLQSLAMNMAARRQKAAEAEVAAKAPKGGSYVPGATAPPATATTTTAPPAEEPSSQPAPQPPAQDPAFPPVVMPKTSEAVPDTVVASAPDTTDVVAPASAAAQPDFTSPAALDPDIMPEQGAAARQALAPQPDTFAARYAERGPVAPKANAQAQALMFYPHLSNALGPSPKEPLATPASFAYATNPKATPTEFAAAPPRSAALAAEPRTQLAAAEPEQLVDDDSGYNRIDAAAAPRPASDVPLPRGDPRTVGGVRATMRNELSQAGLSPAAIAGMEMNVRDESNFNPNLRHPDQPKFGGEAHYAHGLYQEGGDEWNRYQAWLDKNYPDSDWRDPALQSRFAALNLKQNYAPTFDRLNAAQTPGAAADAYLREYLRPAAYLVASRSARYLGPESGGGSGPAGSTRVAQGEGPQGSLLPPEARGGSEKASTVRDNITMALLSPGAGDAPQPPDEEQPSEAKLQDVIGMRGPKPPRGATAMLGRPGVMSDAPPAASPMGALGGINESVEDRRNAITNSILQQPQPAPEVPQENPTPASATSPTTGSPSTPPPSTSAAGSSGPVYAQADLSRFGTVSDTGQVIGGFPSPSAVRPPPATITDIRPAPAEAAPSMPPSREPIPGGSVQEMPDPGPAPKPPAILGPSKNQQYWQQFVNNPNASSAMRAHAKDVVEAEEKYRTEIQGRQQAAYVNDRERWEAATLAKQKFDREAPDRVIEQLTKRVALEVQQATATKAPLDRQKIQIDIQNSQADLEDKLYKQGMPRQQAQQEAALRISNATADLEKKYYEAGAPREQAQKETDLKIRQAERNLAKPDTFMHEGVQYERAPGGGSFQPAPGSPGEQINPNADQAKELSFYQRGKRAMADLGTGNELNNFYDWYAGGMPVVGNYLSSAKFQQQYNAAKEFTAVVLRRESGAAVTPKEVSDVIDRYIAKPGSSPELALQKQYMREGQVASFRSGLGKAMPLADKFDQEFVLERARLEQEKKDTVEAAKLGTTISKLPPISINSKEQRDALPAGRQYTLPTDPPGQIRVKK